MHAYAVDHRGEIERLTSEHDALPVDEDARESSGSSRRAELAERIATLRAEMERSKITWVLRTLTPQEYADQPVQPDELDDDDDETRARKARLAFDISVEQIALQSRAPEDCANPALYDDLPNLTADQWRKVAGVIGFAQWAVLLEQANTLIMAKVAVPDFSQSVSATLKPPTSSES